MILCEIERMPAAVLKVEMDREMGTGRDGGGGKVR